jgi:hypothetical protein
LRKPLDERNTELIGITSETGEFEEQAAEWSRRQPTQAKGIETDDNPVLMVPTQVG